MDKLILTNGWYWVLWKNGGKLEILRYTDLNGGEWVACGDDFTYSREDFVVWGPVPAPLYLGCGWCNATGIKPNQTKVEQCPHCSGSGLYRRESY